MLSGRSRLAASRESASNLCVCKGATALWSARPKCRAPSQISLTKGVYDSFSAGAGHRPGGTECRH